MNIHRKCSCNFIWLLNEKEQANGLVKEGRITHLYFQLLHNCERYFTKELMHPTGNFAVINEDRRKYKIFAEWIPGGVWIFSL
jgi:hypothetical protein